MGGVCEKGTRVEELSDSLALHEILVDLEGEGEKREDQERCDIADDYNKCSEQFEVPSVLLAEQQQCDWTYLKLGQKRSKGFFFSRIMYCITVNK